MTDSFSFRNISFPSMKRLYNYLLLLLFLGFSNLINAQSILVYSEDFENGPGSFVLNNGLVGNNSGSNFWVVNNDFTGAPVYPNTISQDSTTGGLINFAPFSNYLHITDSATFSASPNIANANFNPQVASDRFASTGPNCTLGMDSVRIVFYANCQGNPGAYGELYYSALGGPWTQVPGAQFSSINKWTYFEFYNPVFNNLSDVRFGFRWVNSSTQEPLSGSLGIDGLRIVGKYDPVLYDVRLELDSISPTTVCKGDKVILFFSNPVQLCGTGFYQVQLSDEFGNFDIITNLGIYQLNNLNPIQILQTEAIPSTLNENPCYKIRVVRGDIDPIIISDTSVCINVVDCPNSVVTGSTAVISNPADTVCVGSVIDTKFNSFGVFVNNTYVLQLSDSNGNFPPNPNVLGNSNDDASYPGDPGSVSGLIAVQNHPIPPGCNYYLRVIATSPYTIGTLQGPFCIRECDIESNNKQDVQFCIDDINGGDTLITVEIGVYPPPATYTAPNEFQLQVLDYNGFFVINTGVVGSVAATSDTTVLLTIPNIPNLGSVGLAPGNYYMRVVSTNSSQGWDQLGTLIRLTIGAPNPTGLTIDLVETVPPFAFVDFDLDTTICFNTALFFYLQPFKPQSTYVWGLNNFTNFYQAVPPNPYNPVLFNGVGDYTVYVTETNFGCVGPGSEIAKVKVVGPPNVSIIGPSQACVGDTVQYNLPLSEDTYYAWNSNLATVIDSLNNEVNFFFPTSGTVPIFVQTVNDCGNLGNSRNILIRPLPNADAGNDTTICEANPVLLSTPTGSSYKFTWSTDNDEFSTNRQVEVVPDSTTTYIIEVNSNGSLACTAFDTITVNVQFADTGKVKVIKTCAGENVMLAGDSLASSYLWSTGENAAIITVKDTGWYTVLTQLPDELCPKLDSFLVKNKPCFQELTFPNAFSPNGDKQNDYFSAITSFAYDEFYVKIYNRWGLRVHESINPYFEWNGYDLAGNLLPDGTYFYIAAYKYQDKSKEFKGSVTLLK